MKPDDPAQPRNKGGRPLGSMSKLARDARDKAQASGLLPHEILLSMARGEPQKEFQVDPATGALLVHPSTGELVVRYVSLDVEQRRDAAKAAAPYYAPKISTVEVIAGIQDADIDQLIAQLAAETGLAAPPLGEGEEAEEEGGAGGVPRKRRRVD